MPNWELLICCTRDRIRVGKNGICPPYKSTKDIPAETTAPPSPLPAGEQAPAVLAERRSDAAQVLEEFKKRFGRNKGCHQPLSQEQFEERRQRQMSALLALGAAEDS